MLTTINGIIHRHYRTEKRKLLMFSHPYSVPPIASPTAIIQQRKSESFYVYMLKKTMKNAIPNPPSHPAGFRALLPLNGITAIELVAFFEDTVLFEEYPPVAVGGYTGFELDPIGIVG